MAAEDPTKTSVSGSYRMTDLSEVLKQLQEIPQFQELAAVLTSQGKMPDISSMSGNGVVGGDYNPGTNKVRVDSRINPNLQRSVVVHELTHALQQVASSTLKAATSDTPGVTNTLRRLLTGQNFKPLLETLGRKQEVEATPLEQIYPELFAKTSSYRKGRAEQQAHGYGNSVRDAAPTSRIPHVDATNATEVAIIMDLVKRQQAINGEGSKKK
jgi:hypothetical protein